MHDILYIVYLFWIKNYLNITRILWLSQPEYLINLNLLFAVWLDPTEMHEKFKSNIMIISRIILLIKTGAIRIGTILGNPQNISEVVKAKKINLSIDVLINVMNATLDFNQVYSWPFIHCKHGNVCMVRIREFCHDRTMLYVTWKGKLLLPSKFCEYQTWSLICFCLSLLRS